jgi:hypothetical protein
MRILAGALVALVAGWAVWWWFAASAIERAAGAWFATLAEAGWEVRQDGVAVAGFPARLDLTVTAPRLYDPVQGIGWEGPFAQVLTLAYQPWHVIAALPPEQTITLGPAAAQLRSDRLRASVVVQPLPALPLARLAVEGDGLELGLPAASLSVEALRAGLRGAGDGAAPHQYDAAFTLSGIAPLRLLPAGGLPAGVPADLPPGTAAARFDAALRLTAPLDRHAAQSRPQLAAIALREARFAWGPMALTATGSIAAESSGHFAGRIEIVADDWPGLVGLATRLGLVAPALAPTWIEVGRALSAASPTPGRVVLPLVMAGGRMSLGPFPLGPAPRIGP